MPKKKANYWKTLLKSDRQIWSRSFPGRKECFNAARIKGNEGLEKFICAHCTGLFAKSEVECDHKIPINNTIPLSYEEYEICNRRLHCSKDNLQIICKPCHRDKSKRETHERKRLSKLTLMKA